MNTHPHTRNNTPTRKIAALAVIAAALLAASGCEERPSADATDSSVEQQTDPTGAVEGTEQPGTVETDADPTPQTGTGGAIPQGGQQPSE